MPQHIVILGGGVGGTIVANVAARALGNEEAKITLIDATGQHVYMPGWLYLPFNRDEGIELSRPEQSLLHHRVQLLVGVVERVDPAERCVRVRRILAGGESATEVVPFDHLVIATGSRLSPQDLPGLVEGAGQWHDFYSLDGALRLRSALHEFEGGRIVVAIGGIPYRCPPAPLEFVFLLDEWLTKRNIRSHTEIQYLYPLPRVFPIESVAELATPLLDERGIKYETFFNTESVDTERKVLTSLEGSEISYDLLVMIPPHRGVAAVEASGLSDPQGWIPTERTTLEVKGQTGMYAIGDATDLPVSKSGSAAHFEAKVVAKRIIAAIRGEATSDQSDTYPGEVMCFLETGHNQASQLVFDYEHPPRPPRPSMYYHMEKQLFNRAYWYIVPQGLV